MAQKPLPIYGSENVELLWINISHLSKPLQFILCSFSVFVFYLIYGYLQVRLFTFVYNFCSIFRKNRFKKALVFLFIIYHYYFYLGIHIRYRFQTLWVVPDSTSIRLLYHSWIF